VLSRYFRLLAQSLILAPDAAASWRAAAGKEAPSVSSKKRGRTGRRMSRHLRFLSKRASSFCPAALRQLDFGEVVAVLIVAIGLVPFASAGLWPSP